MNEVKPLFDKNNETNYIATEANVKPIEMTENKHKDWWEELCKGPSLIEMAKERGFVCNNDLKIHYKYLEQCEKERNLTDAEKADKRNLEILKKW